MAKMMAVIIASALCGCASDAGDAGSWSPAPPADDGTRAVKVWVQDHPLLRHNAAAEGCDLWYPEGIRCDLDADERDADVRVYAYDGPCTKNADGTYTLAMASPDRNVVVWTQCFRPTPDAKIDDDAFRTVMGHEIGHQLGVWLHVPETCAEPHLTHPSGGPVCGQALMNPIYDPNVSFITGQDHLAFEMRDRDLSVLADKSAASGGAPTCKYVRR